MLYLTVRTWLFISVAFARTKQRLVALFLVALISFGVIYPPVSVLAATSSDQSPGNTAPKSTLTKTSTIPSMGTINMNPVPAPSTTLKSSIPAAANASPIDGGAGLLGAGSTGSGTNAPAAQLSTQKQSFQPHELVNARTATSSTYLNKDGSLTKTKYFTPRFYQNNGNWDSIDTTLVEDKNAADSGNFLGQLWGTVESWFSSPNAYVEKANGWLTRFTPSNFTGGMVRIKQGNDQVGFSPINANEVNPSMTTDAKGQQTVRYDNLWNNVDVTYKVESGMVKESIILKSKSAAAQVQFKLIGANLQKTTAVSKPGDVEPDFIINGALGDHFGIAHADLVLNHFGIVDDKTSGISQSYSGDMLTVGVDNAYLQSLPDNAFPAVIDPTVASTFGARGVGSYISFESNGTSCYPSTCDLNAGGLYDSNHVWQDWRGALFAPYTEIAYSSTTLTSATLYLSGMNTVTPGTYAYQVGEATCQNSYSCMDKTWDSANVTNATGGIDVTNIYQDFKTKGNVQGWLMVDGADGTGTASFADFDPDWSYVNITYTTPLPAPTFTNLQSGQVFTDPQATFKLNTETNPNDSTPLQYEFQVVDGTDGTGFVINSNGGNSNASTSWTVPDGALQNGSTYYIEAMSFDSSTGYSSPWSAPLPFRIDMRRGNDKTQTYDTFGPAKTDLVTGNLATGITSHTTKALGGDMGVDLHYNSPIKSSTGLVGAYWNNGQGSASSPQFQRNDQNIDFNWNSVSPGYPINATNWNAQWNGYFVAPSTGNYTFGAINGGNLTITVNGQQLYNNALCSSGPCFGTSNISLTAGQVVSFQAYYTQGTGNDYVTIYVKGAVSQQVIPKDWLQTGVRLAQPQGLTGRYYTYTDTGSPPTFPSNGTDGLFMTRIDPDLNFWVPEWWGNLPVTNGPAVDWMVRWTGYLTVPVTGSYTFGAQVYDGIKITVNGTQVLSSWCDCGSVGQQVGTAINLTAGQRVPIDVDYYKHNNQSNVATIMNLDVQSTAFTGIVPTGWITPQANVLPNGWSLGNDPDGTLTYTHLSADPSSAVLTNASGDTFEYKWNGTGYTPPANSYGSLVRNYDGSFTLQDSDGRTYVFDINGNLSSVTNPTDDAHQASLQYSFGAVNGSGPSSIQQITDGVNASRWAKVYYGGASQCGTPPSGFGATPANMLCALQTNDGRTTNFYYDTNGNLAEVLRPGNDATSYQYQAVQNAGATIGYQLSGIRDNLANDAIVAGVRTNNDQTTYTQITYDAVGRATSITEPQPNSGASPTSIQHTIDYANVGTVAWRQSQSVSDTVAGRPIVVSWGGTRLDAFARGSANDLIHRWSDDGVTWSAWESLGGCIQNDPGAAAWGPNRLDIIVEGCASSSNIWHSWWDGSWHWEQLSGTATGSPSVTSWAANRLDVFVPNTSSGLSHLYFQNSWGSWENLSGTCLNGAPSAVTNAQQRIDVFYRNCNSSGNNLSHETWTSSWSGQVNLSAQVSSQPAIGTLGGDAVEVVAASGSAINHWTFSQSSGNLTANPDAQICSNTAPYLFGFQGVETMYTRDCSAPSAAMQVWQYGLPFGTSTEHIVGAVEPNGYSQRVEYDKLFRTTKSTDVQGLSSTTLWDLTKDLQYSTTAPTGLMSAVVYDGEDRPVTQYGPAPTTWYSQTLNTVTNHFDIAPQSAYASQVARNDASYDQGLTGLAASYTAVNEPVANRASLSGAPLLHGTNIASDGTITHDWGTTPPVTAPGGNWGFSMTGMMRLPTAGNWVISPTQDGGARVWIDNQLVVDYWWDNTAANTRKTESYTYNNTVANSLHSVRIDYYHLAVTSDAYFSLAMTPPGSGQTTQVASYFSPDYSMKTTATAYDATYGNTTATTSYGSNPALGMAQSATVDPSGLNLTSNIAYETPGSGYLRPISSTLPGGANTTYTYWNATDTSTNPCVQNSPAAMQAGLMHKTTDPTGRVSEVIYDDAGRAVASRYNTDPWTCLYYDSRGRTTETDVPAINGATARTMTTNYNVGGNPLVVSSTDNQGTVTATSDLLGRTVSYTDTLSKTTTTTFDNLGRLSGRTGPEGTESYVYDNYNRLSSQKLNGTVVATPSYDAYGRLSSVATPTAGSQGETITRNTFGATTGLSYTLGNGSAGPSDAVTLSQSGRVTSGTQLGNSESYNYDAAGRLVSASIGSNSYAYGYGTPTGCTGSYNSAAGKDGNRTSQTINGVTTNYCYNSGDQLISSTDGSTANPTYDSHGNTTALGTTAFGYDSSDRNSSITQGSTSTAYTRDVSGRVTQRVTSAPVGTTLPAPWVSTDIGNPDISGSAGYSGGVYTVNGAGYDVWGSDDQFQFAHQSMTGDGTIIARVTSQTNTNDWAKAGIVIKDTTTSGSNYVSIHTTPGHGIRMEYNYNVDIAGASFTFPNAWLKLVKSGNTVTGYDSVDGSTWTQVGTATVTFGAMVQAGLMTASVNETTLGSATFDNVSVSQTGASTLPFGWSNQDTGTPSIAGSSAYSNGVYTIKGAGADVWGSNDQSQIAYKTLTGDGQIIARVTSQTNTNAWAKAGIVIKNSTTAGSNYVSIMTTPGNGVQMDYNYSNDIAGGSYTFPNAWLKLVRSGGTYTGYQSADGVTWTRVGTANITISSTALIGVFVTSHNTSTLGTATFDNVSVTSSGTTIPSGWANQDIGSPAVTGSSSYSSGIYTVNGAGADVWGSNDQFQYTYKSLTGDGQIIARVTSQTNTNAWAKAGIEIKTSTVAGSNYVNVMTTPSNGVQMDYNYNSDIAGGSYTFPNAWLKLVRSGSTITTYQSADGSNWTQVGSTSSVLLPTTALIGVFVSSHNTTTLGTATFDNVSVTSNPTINSTTYNYGFAGSGSGPAICLTVQAPLIESYIMLPGGMMLTKNLYVRMSLAMGNKPFHCLMSMATFSQLRI